MLKLPGPSRKRLKQYLEEDKLRINSLTNQLQEAQQQVQGLREELAREKQKSAEYEKTIQELRQENARLSEQSALRESGERRMLAEADEKKLIELYKERDATELQARRFAQKLLADLEKAGITLYPREGEEVQGKTAQELQQSTVEPAKEEPARELHQRQRERKRTHGVTAQEQRGRPEDGFIEENSQLKPGEFTPRERKFQQEGGRGG